MDDLENKPGAQPDLAELQSQHCCFQRQILALLVLLFVVSGTFNVYLLRQFRAAHNDLKQATATMEMVDKEKAMIGNILNKLADYGKTHPDFAQTVLNKYGIRPASPPAANPPPASNPPPAAQPKK
jgi:hypothetical protein